jgi:asparagine synthase (glutamine-hydrolysing)
MCGIAGYTGRLIEGLAARMNAAQCHRGPDGRGVFEDPEAGIALGHVRLAILDLSDAAAQPMRSVDGRFVISFNGEIYNFRALRSDLELNGWRFRTTSDTEVLLNGYAEWGEKLLNRLDGIFAFALWDSRERELLVVRDPLGVKPLYYTETAPGCLVFASEIKALCAHPALRREPDFEAILQHLSYCHACGDRTAIKDVRRLPAGASLRWRADSRTWRIARYCSLEPQAPTGNRAEEIERLRDAVRAAAQRQLVSDVPVGVCLSGGLDSTFVTKSAVERLGSDLRAFTISYSGNDAVLDTGAVDAVFARRVAESNGLQLHEIRIQPQVANLWPRLVWHLDEPIADPAAIASHLISAAAREAGVPVLLSGQGADELFCGYPRYPVMHATRWLDHAPRSVGRASVAVSRLLPGGREGSPGVALRQAKRVLASLDRRADERFLAYCANSPESEARGVLGPAFREEIDGRRFHDDCLELMDADGLTGHYRFQRRDTTVYLPNHNLLYTDKTGMANGVETRVPLLDLDIVRRALGYPYEWQVKWGQTKVLFREAARGVVPDAIIDRRKAGFSAPYRKWLRYDLSQMWHDLSSPEVVRRRGWFDPAALASARDRSQAGQVDLYMLQWAVLTVELWARQFIDRNPSDAAA